MKIVIPMSGIGKRFADEGYREIKPLIMVHGKPIIEWVISLFPGNHDFVFICREEHLKQTELKKVLNSLKPNAEIVSIKGHKLGPVYAVSQAFHLIHDDEEVIANYCDFFQIWDFEDFQKTVKQLGSHGSIPCYTGFHPHLLHPENLYASCKTNEKGNLIEIKEKHSFETDKTKTNHSGGTYYFAKGKYIKKYFQQLMDNKIDLNGEYYISMVYNAMVKDGLDIHIYNKVPFFCQWGTPKDLIEYENWMKIMGHYKRRGIPA